MWEYLHKNIDIYCCYQEGFKENGDTNFKHINYLGLERWELVAIRPMDNGWSLAIFKRPKLGLDHEMGPEYKSPYQDLR